MLVDKGHPVGTFAVQERVCGFLVGIHFRSVPCARLHHCFEARGKCCSCHESATASDALGQIQGLQGVATPFI